MRFIKHTFLLTVLTAIFSFGLHAQNNTSSVYSKFGIGDLATVGYGRGLAMGGTGIGWRSANYLNAKNPASLTAIDTLSFLLETGVNGKYTISSSFEHTQDYWNGNLTHLMFGHRITPWLAGSFGFMPYSNIGYQMRTTNNTNVINSMKITEWKGTGGISKVFYSTGLRLGKYFSLGAEAAFLYGPMSETRRTYFVVNEVINDRFVSVLSSNQYTYYESLSRYGGFDFKGGFQFSTKLGTNGSSFGLGAVVSPGTKLVGKSDVTIKQAYPNLSSLDSVYSAIDVRATPIETPLMYGGGLSFNWKGKYLLAADYEGNLWGSLGNKSYKDQTIISVGIERLPQTSLKFADRCAYRLGFRYDNGYLNVKGFDIEDMRFSLGYGLPLQKSRSMLNFSLEAGQRGTRSVGLVRERYAQMTVAFSFHDYWFIKRKFD